MNDLSDEILVLQNGFDLLSKVRIRSDSIKHTISSLHAPFYWVPSAGLEKPSDNPLRGNGPLSVIKWCQ